MTPTETVTVLLPGMCGFIVFPQTTPTNRSTLLSVATATVLYSVLKDQLLFGDVGVVGLSRVE